MAAEGQRRVLLCLDGSETASNMFDWYLENLNRPNDYVYGMCVVEYDVSGITAIRSAGGADPVAISKQFAEKYKENEKLTADYTARLRSARVKGQVDTYQGNKPGEIICNTADMLNVDCICIGTRGLGKIKRAILGSVSQFVILNSGRPTTVVPKAEW